MIRNGSFISILSASLLIALSPLNAPARAQAPADVDAVFDDLAAKHGAAPAFVRLLTDNVDSWYARWHMMSGAKQTIDCTYFIIENDIFGRSMLGMLYKKAREGVKVRLMVDARGTKALARTFLGQDLLQEMVENKNIEIRVYNPVAKALLRIPVEYRSAVASNHDKLLIVDGEWLITGGRNISKAYFADASDDPDVYRDTDVLIRGGATPGSARTAFDEEWNKPANTVITKDFFGNWVSRTRDLELARRAMNTHMLGLATVNAPGLDLGPDLASVQAELDPFQKLRSFMGYEPFRGERAYPVLLLDKHSLYRNTRNDISANLARFCDAAQSEIIIQNPYVVLSGGAREALKRASARGIEVIINTNSPESTDSALTQAMFVREWKQLLHDIPRLRIYALEGHNKLHAKVFVVDKKVTLVGTYNMDPLSEDVNSEDVAVIKSSAFATMNWHRIQKEIKLSVEYKIRVRQDGKLEQLVGPSDHVERRALDWIQRLGWLAFLRPLI